MEIENGEVLTLALLEHVDTGGDDSPGVIFDVTYEHDRVEFRTAGQKDAVAFGRGKLEHDRDWRDCRILFSQYHKTASIRGLTFDAPVKIASMTKAEFRDMQKTFQGPRGLKEQRNEESMKGWKTNDYFNWKSWSRIQAEKRDEELAKNSASPIPLLALSAVFLIAAAAGLLFVLASVLR
ncbi:hypothetical protein [Stenotrophomonas maltophilia]|uniref:hypothetical protein n=1 Tax=Stenotrophomonas maltophilia TaxID=40324 RepID=UPI001269ABF1|nr:hypothetical protein [Stenotrophomonas maltophilia]